MAKTRWKTHIHPTFPVENVENFFWLWEPAVEKSNLLLKNRCIQKSRTETVRDAFFIRGV